MFEDIVSQAPVVSPKLGALAEVVTNPTLIERASSIFEGIRAVAENPGSMSLESLGLGIAAIASAPAATRAVQEIFKDRSEMEAKQAEEEIKKAAEKSARTWAQADGSLIAYTELRSGGLERSLVSATSDVNRFISRSDPRVQALDIALKLPKEERLASAMGMEEALDDFRKFLPRDAGIAQNHATLARLSTTPVEGAATAERAAFGALERGDAVTAKAREACFTLLQASAARAVAIERGEWTQEMVRPKEAPAPEVPGPGRKGKAARGWDR